MTTTSIGAVALACLGIWMILESAGFLAFAFGGDFTCAYLPLALVMAIAGLKMFRQRERWSEKLFGQDGQEVTLTAMEFNLLKAFAEHPNRVLSRDQLLELAHDRGWEPFDRSIDIRIARIRRKIEPDPSTPQVIKTVRGAGYIFANS